MNKLLTLIFILSISIFSKAQVFEKTYHDAPMIFGEVLAPIGNGEILIGTQSGEFLGWGSFTPELYKLDTDGNIIWTNILNNGFVFGDMKMVRDIEVLNENEYFILLTYEGCDYGGNHKLIKIDGDGNQIWSVIELGNSFDNPKIKLLENGNIVIITGLEIYLISEEGLLLQSESMQIRGKEIVEYSDTSIVVAGKLGFVQIELNQDPFIYNYFIDDLNYYQIKKINSGELLILQDTGIWKLDQNLVKVDSILFNFKNQFLTFDVDTNHLYLFGTTTDDSLLVRTLDFDFDWKNDFILGGENIVPRDIKIDNENLTLTAINQDGFVEEPYSDIIEFGISTGPFGIKNSSLWIKSFPKNTLPPKEQIDIGISNIQISSVEVQDSTVCFFGETEGSFYFNDVKITVKNFGSETVSNFKINGLFELCPFICPSWFSYHESYVNVMLQPGEEMEFDLGTLFYPALRFSGDEYELCFWTSNPDNKTDVNFSNNRFCLTLDVLSTDLKNLVQENTFEVFPNPTSDNLNIKWSEDFNAKNSSIIILDAFGKVVKQIFSKNSEVEIIDLNGMDTGIYFVKIITEDGKFFTKKVIKTPSF